MIQARKAVILTSGGFQFNSDMVKRHTPWAIHAAPLGVNGGPLANIGSGQKMAMAVGAE